MSTKTQYRVMNVGSREPLTDWLDSETEAHAAAAEAEEHETQPDCSVESREVEAVEYTTRNIEYLVCVRTMSGVVQVFGRYTTREEAVTIAELVDGWVEANLI